MDDALPIARLSGRMASDPLVKVEFKAGFEEDGLSEQEMEVLSPFLAELVGELLQMGQDQETE